MRYDHIHSMINCIGYIQFGHIQSYQNFMYRLIRISHLKTGMIP